MFNSYVKLPEGTCVLYTPIFLCLCMSSPPDDRELTLRMLLKNDWFPPFLLLVSKLLDTFYFYMAGGAIHVPSGNSTWNIFTD